LVKERNLEYRVSGVLKFFVETMDYGFIVSDVDGSDLFFHYADIE
jgi:cold shock CspA family protein